MQKDMKKAIIVTLVLCAGLATFALAYDFRNTALAMPATEEVRDPQPETSSTEATFDDDVLDVFLPRAACAQIISQSFPGTAQTGMHFLEVLCKSRGGDYTGFYTRAARALPHPKRIAYHFVDQDEMTVALR